MKTIKKQPFNDIHLELKESTDGKWIVEINRCQDVRKNRTSQQMTLREWLIHYIDKKKAAYSRGTIMGYISIMKILEKYGDSILLKSVDKEYCKGFIDFISQPIESRYGGKRDLSASSIYRYYEIFSSIINAAVRAKLLEKNPLQDIERSEKPHRVESRRHFLSIEEVQKLINTSAKREDVKQAFLFSCFCGLRWSDISQIRWKDIEENNGRVYANIVMKKNKEPLYLPLNEPCRRFMPKKMSVSNGEDFVFKTLPTCQTANYVIRNWADSAGITKKVSFHVARHTFATISLTLGADIYTTSKLLGHSNIMVTQVYAKVVNKKKNEVVDLFNTVF
ncbi:MAG: site-specific integrase [Bacteroidales bacterium]|nr:site-specific integrase [Bacteroidales bacterium]